MCQVAVIQNVCRLSVTLVRSCLRLWVGMIVDQWLFYRLRATISSIAIHSVILHAVLTKLIFIYTTPYTYLPTPSVSLPAQTVCSHL